MKIFRKITSLLLGASMALGIGLGISQSNSVIPVHAVDSTTEYTLINDTADLEVGKSYIITNGISDTVRAIAVDSNSNNRKTTEVTVVDGKITRGASIMSFTLGGEEDAWTFATENYAGTAGYLASASNDKNYLRVISTAGLATISFNSDEAVINIGPHSTRTQIRYNPNNGSPLFACYSSGQQPVYLWKETSSACTHNWIAGTVHNPTCTEQGYTEYECSLCGETKDDNFVAALGHDYGEWIIDTEATCTAEGTKHRVCSRDVSHIENEIIPATGHTWEDGVCIVCGAVQSNIIMEAGTNGSSCTVNGMDGIKVGTSKANGDMTITIPAEVTKIKLYIAAWKGTTSGNVELSGVVTDTLDISADDGISNNSPFTLVGDETDFRVDLTVTAGTLTITSGTARRFVVWGATDKFASEFEAAWGYLTCDASGTTAPTIGGGYSWTSFKNIYNSLDAEEQGIIQANSTITARYDYIVGKYGTSTYEDFMHRNPAPIGNSRALLGVTGLDVANNAAIIIVVSIIAISACCGYIILRKKKEN